MSGYAGFSSAFIESHQEGKPPPANVEMSAFIVDQGRVYLAGIDSEKGLLWTLEATRPAATGSGMDHAITAMDCGLSAKDAVRMAIKRDAGSGGRVRTFKVKPIGKPR